MDTKDKRQKRAREETEEETTTLPPQKVARRGDEEEEEEEDVPVAVLFHEVRTFGQRLGLAARDLFPTSSAWLKIPVRKFFSHLSLVITTVDALEFDADKVTEETWTAANKFWVEWGSTVDKLPHEVRDEFLRAHATWQEFPRDHDRLVEPMAAMEGEFYESWRITRLLELCANQLPGAIDAEVEATLTTWASDMEEVQDTFGLPEPPAKLADAAPRIMHRLRTLQSDFSGYLDLYSRAACSPDQLGRAVMGVARAERTEGFKLPNPTALEVICEAAAKDWKGDSEDDTAEMLARKYIRLHNSKLVYLSDPSKWLTKVAPLV